MIVCLAVIFTCCLAVMFTCALLTFKKYKHDSVLTVSLIRVITVNDKYCEKQNSHNKCDKHTHLDVFLY